MSAIKFPLDDEAVDAADDRFYDKYPELIDEDGNRIPLSADDPAQEQMRRDWIAMYKEELKKTSGKDDPKDPKDPEDPIDPVKPCPHDGPCEHCTPIASIDLVSLTFLNDHGLLKSEETRWTDTGTPFDPPDWTAAGVKHPVSVTHETHVKVKVEYAVAAEDACPEGGTISATAFGNHAYGYNAVDFAPSKTPAAMEPIAVYKAPRLIQQMDTFDVEWTAVADSTHAMGTSQNEMFTIFGPSKLGEFPEDGATLKRMRTSVDWAKRALTVKEIDIIEYLFDQFDRYVLGVNQLTSSEQAELKANPDLLAALTDADWPTFFAGNNGGVGAWPIADDKRWGAECQAICRFIRGMMRQIGAKSTLDFRTYTADFSDPETPLNQGQATGPRADLTYALADEEVRALRTYWKPVEDSSGIPLDIPQNQGPWPGWNNFEAYLKVTPDDGSEVRLFGGGVGILRKKMNPLHVFYGIVELKGRTRRIRLPDGSEAEQVGWRVMRLHRYRDEGDWTGPLP
jgi:hypothetical protein